MTSLPQRLERKAASAWNSVKGKDGNAVMKTGATLDLHTASANSQLPLSRHLHFHFIINTNETTLKKWGKNQL